MISITENFKTTYIITMNLMFYNYDKLISFDLSMFNTEYVVNVNNLFYNCKQLVSVKLSNWNTTNIIYYVINIKNVESISSWFDNRKSLISLDLSNFDTKKVDDITFIFWRFSSLKYLNISNFCMLFECYSLASLYISSFNDFNFFFIYK